VHKAAFALALFSFAAPAWAGNIKDPICTDRPGKGSATCAVPKGHWQIETNLADWSLTETGKKREQELDLAQVTIKYGVSDSLHIEVALPAYVIKTKHDGSRHERDTGVNDVKVKLKQELTGGKSNFSAALYPFVKLPTASKSIGNDKVEGGMVVPLGLSFGDSPWSLSAAPELDAVPDGDGHGYHPALVQQASINLQATDKLALSGELWGKWEWEHGQTTRQASIDGSAAYKLSSELQIDGGANFGLNRNTADIELYGGVSMRF